MLLYKILSLLLDYPSAELRENWGEIKGSVAGLGDATEQDKHALRTFISWAEPLALTAFQAEYVKTFDLNPDNALYLTHHLFEEQDRERGPTLVNLSLYLKSQGYAIQGGELPDYLPLLLEYCSTLEDEMGAWLFLKESAHVSEVVAKKLENIGSPYALLLRIVERHGRLSAKAA